MSERVLLLSSRRSFPLTRGTERVELEEEEEEELVERWLALDCDVCAGRVTELKDCRCVRSFFFALSFAVCGTPSHFELTLGTVIGSFADETPGKPTAFARPFCVVPRFFICSW